MLEFKVIETAATVPMDNYSFDTVEQLKQAFSARTRAYQTYKACAALLEKDCGAKMPAGQPPEVETYRVHVAFDALKDPQERAYFLSLPTRLSLPPETVNRLVAVAGQLLDESATYQKLRRDVK